MTCKPVLFDTISRDRRLETSAETMAAALLAHGWTERRPGVWGVGDELEADELSGADNSPEVVPSHFGDPRVTSDGPIALPQGVLGSIPLVTRCGDDVRD